MSARVAWPLSRGLLASLRRQALATHLQRVPTFSNVHVGHFRGDRNKPILIVRPHPRSDDKVVRARAHCALANVR